MTEIRHTPNQMAGNATTQTVTRGAPERWAKTTLRIPAEVHKAMRRLSIDTGTDTQDLYVEAARDYLKKLKIAA